MGSHDEPSYASRMTDKLNIIVLFGGPTTEHEVTVVTAHEVMKALDPARFTSLPVYWAPDGNFYTGAAVMDRAAYPFSPDMQRQLKSASFTAFERTDDGRAVLRVGTDGLFSRAERFIIDAAIPVAHGTMVEDGNLQGFLTVLGIPFTGSATMASGVFMNKMATKKLLSAHGVPVLPATLVARPASGFADYQQLAASVEKPGPYPLIVKPNFLGSSVGVTRATNEAELAAGIALVFKFDTAAIIEPCVEPLVEYNVSVSRAWGDGVRLSAIERPTRKGDVLDFKTKYIGGGKKAGAKKIGAGMRFAGRELNPTELTNAQRHIITTSAHTAMTAVDGAGGAPRIDFICNGSTGEIWLNEVNPCPGDFASFLWEYAEQPQTFTELLNGLVDEALARRKSGARLTDPAQAGATIFRR
jgi:D-alanine-D-alanine ligase